MKKEEFVALGISEELAVKAAEASKKELAGYVPKEQLDAANTAKASLENDIAARDRQLEDLKKTSGDNAALQQQIADLQAENKTAKEKYEADIKDLKLSAAIKLALGDSAQDAELVTGLFDRSKLILGEDGKVTGLDEQLKSIQEAKPFLFKEQQKDQKPAGFRPIGANGQQKPATKTEDGSVDMRAAIEARLQSQMSQAN